MPSDSVTTICSMLSAAGYGGLFLSGDRRVADAVWQNGQNRIFLEQIVRDHSHSDLERFLASEVLYEKALDYPSAEWRDILAYLYARALAISGDPSGKFQIPGNQWGFMYHLEARGVRDDGVLAVHLLAAGEQAIPHLSRLLENPNPIFYEGSQEATLGNSLRYRVKDAAAYFIGRITGIPVRFHENIPDRDAEIEALKAVLKKHVHE